MEDWSKKVADIPEEEKLAVAELSLKFGDFWRVFRVDCPKKLSGFKTQLQFDTAKFDKFQAALARCQNLEQLELELDIFESDSMSFQSRFRRKNKKNWQNCARAWRLLMSPCINFHLFGNTCKIWNYFPHYR